MRQGGQVTEPALPYATELILWNASKAIGGAQSATTTILHAAWCV